MRTCFLGLTVCVVASAWAAGPANAHSLCRPVTVGGIPVDPFGRPCITGQVFDGGVDLFVGAPVLIVPERSPHRRFPQRLPQQQPLSSFGFTTGSIGPFTTGPLSPSTTPLAPAPFIRHRR